MGKITNERTKEKFIEVVSPINGAVYASATAKAVIEVTLLLLNCYSITVQKHNSRDLNQSSGNDD